MLKLLKETNRLNETIFVGVLTVLCVALSMFRHYYTGSNGFLFLNWNLFLAIIPWALTTMVTLYPRLVKSRISIFILISVWLLFFPNAPYILTDLFHLRYKSVMPMWFDLILILFFAWTGLLYGLLSLWDLEKMMTSFMKQKYVIYVTVFLLFLSSFGIYIGRFLRWNSWDIIRKPFHVLSDVTDRIVNPFDYPKTWGVTIFMGLFLIVIYLSFKVVRRNN